MPTAYFVANNIIFRALDANGNPSPGAKAEVFEAGTATPLTVYQDSALTTPHASPIVADANGIFPPIYISGADVIKIDVTDSNDVQLPGYPVDDITGIPVGGLTAAGVVFAPTATLADVNVQDALETLDTLTQALPIPNTTFAATSRIAGRVTAGAGAGEELTIADAAAYRAQTADRPLTADVWDAAAEVTLTDAATIAVDMSTFINATVTLTDNRTLGNPTNTKVGQSGVIRVVQDATGSRTLAYEANWEFEGGTAPVLSTGVNDEDLLFYHVISATRIYAALIKNIS